jgi:N4-gp56 family major capsid protein
MVIFRFREVCEPDSIPLRSGKTVQWYRYTLLGANTTVASEGTVGNPIPQTTTTVSATVAEYADFSSLSTLLVETAIDPIVENFSKNLGYRAGLSVDTIARTEFDSAVSSVGLSTLGATLSVQDFRRVGALLAGANIRMGPRMGANYRAIIHPYAKYDLVSDNTAGGFIDLLKYTAGKQVLAGEVGMVDNFRVLETTNVGTTGTSPNVLYYCYLVGQGAVGAVDLPGAGPSNVTDPSKQSFKINVIKGGPNPADPEGMIGSYVSYRFVTVHKILDSTNYRYRIVKADATLV